MSDGMLKYTGVRLVFLIWPSIYMCYFLNLLRSYLIKGLAIPLVRIKYPTISTNLLKHSNRRKGE
jgi:hypothetical protein